jgi:hypothetical protein
VLRPRRKKSRKGKKRIRGEGAEEGRDAKKRDLGREEEEVVSSAPSSPLYEPYLPGDGVRYSRIYHPEIYEAFDAEISNYRQKIGLFFKPTSIFSSSSCQKNFKLKNKHHIWSCESAIE